MKLAFSKLRAGLGGSALIVLSFNLGALFLQFLANLEFSNNLSLTEYGYLIFAQSLVGLLSSAACFGLGTVILREHSVLAQKSAWAELNGLVAFCSYAVLTVSFGVVLIFWTVAYSPLGAGSPALIFAALFVLILPLKSYGVVLESTVRMELSPQRAIFAGSLGQAAILALATTYLARSEELSLERIAAIYFVALSFAQIGNTIQLAHKRPKWWRFSHAVSHRKKWSLLGLSFFQLTVINLVLTQTDVLMLQGLLTSTDVARFGAATRVAGLTALGLAAVNFVFVPKIAKLAAEGERQQLQTLATNAARLSTVFAVVVLAFLTLSGHWILSLFGESFVCAYPVLIIMGFANIANSSCGSSGYLLTLLGHQTLLSRILLLSALLNVGLNFALIPILGINGAAIATGSALIIQNISKTFALSSRCAINSTILRPK